MIASYPKIYNLGHSAIKDLFLDPVVCEEKIDGSQISFGLQDGVLHARSKGRELDLEHPDNMFAAGAQTILKLQGYLVDNWVYRGEYLSKPKHNTLAYDRIPTDHIILYDIQNGPESYLTANEKRREADRLGLECVPCFHYGKVESLGDFYALLENVSVLGGQKVEGIVFKNYHRFGADGKALMGKHVSEAFKEIHRGGWKERNPNRGDVLLSLIASYRTPARWNKAIQHLKEAGELENSPRDIGKLIKEIQVDTLNECGDEIKEKLYAWAKPQLVRGIVAGFPEHYKVMLAQSQFEEGK